MKIEYGPENNTWKILDEVYWLLKIRKNLKKNKQYELKTYSKYVLEINLICLFFIIIDILFFVLSKSFNFVGFIILFIYLLIILIWDFYVFNYIYHKTKNNNGGVIKFNENGVSDCSNGICLSFSWDKVDFVVVGKESLVIMFDSPVCFYLNVKYAKKVIKEMKKYINDLRILKYYEQ